MSSLLPRCYFMVLQWAVVQGSNSLNRVGGKKRLPFLAKPAELVNSSSPGYRNCFLLTFKHACPVMIVHMYGKGPEMLTTYMSNEIWVGSNNKLRNLTYVVLKIVHSIKLRFLVCGDGSSAFTSDRSWRCPVGDEFDCHWHSMGPVTMNNFKFRQTYKSLVLDSVVATWSLFNCACPRKNCSMDCSNSIKKGKREVIFMDVLQLLKRLLLHAPPIDDREVNNCCFLCVGGPRIVDWKDEEIFFLFLGETDMEFHSMRS